MPSYGYSLMCELYDPNELLAQAARAEEAGFDFLTISDHFHPWLHSHHHSPYAWRVLGALAAQTTRVELVSVNLVRPKSRNTWMRMCIIKVWQQTASTQRWRRGGYWKPCLFMSHRAKGRFPWTLGPRSVLHCLLTTKTPLDFFGQQIIYKCPDAWHGWRITADIWKIHV